MDLIIQMAVEAVLLAFGVLLALCAIVGATVAIRPDALDRLKAASERRVSMRRATRPLDIPRNVDRVFYRHHKVYGATVVVLAIFLLYVLVFEGTLQWQALFPEEYRVVGAIVVETARIVLWLASIFALIAGTVVFVRPSALKDLERIANRWVTPRRYTYPLEREYSGLDERLSRYPRAWGTVVAVLSLICIIALIAQWPT
jgi:hypothetical protein